jgi:predicted ATPase/class 3 adenylate cyclase
MITGTVGRDLPAGTVTFLFTDVEGSTKLLHELGAEAYAETLAEHRRIVRGACSAQGGVEVDTQGDAFFLAFPTAREAVEAARAITEELASGPIALRIGLHTGTPLLTEEGYVGDDVHFAARVAASAHGGQVVLSQATCAFIDDRHPLLELGEHRLKDIPEPVAIFQLGAGQFPPLKTISNTNLPRPASSFVGRARELQEVLAGIERGARLLTLTGPGGSGKTRLALEAAATLVPEYKAGVFWVGLASVRDPALVTETIAQTLGAKDGLGEHIGEREVLLLLDNLEQVIEAAPELSSVLQRCPNLTLLVTSRELLRLQGEIEYPVPPLAEAEAVSLFCERAPAEPSAAISELCRRLDNLPLAVELAAARAKSLSPGQILARLSQRLDLLKGGRDADPRQQTLRATIEWSCDLLSDDEQQLFRRLAVFAGGCTLEAAEEVCDADLDILQSLVEKSLIRFANERYWMLETIRELASERLRECDDRPAVRRQHGDFFLELARRAELALRGADVGEWLSALEEDLGNLRAALGWFRESGQVDASLEMIGCTWNFWYTHGSSGEGRRWLEEPLARSQEARTLRRARALAAATVFAHYESDWDATKQYAEEGLEIFRELGDSEWIAWTLILLGGGALELGDYQEAERFMDEAIAQARAAGDRGNLALALGNLGDLAIRRGDHPSAIIYSKEALSLFRELGREDLVRWTLYNLALSLYCTNQDEAAAAAASESLLGYSTTDWTLAWELVLVAALLARRRQAAAGATLMGASDALRDRVGLTLTGAEADLYDETAERLRLALGDQRYDSDQAKGRSMPSDDVIDFARAAVTQ